MIDELTNFSDIESFIKKSNLGLKEALIKYYESLGERMGFTVRRNFTVIKNSINLGKLDLIWVEPNVVFCFEFGNFDEILKHLWKILEFEPKLGVIILSSNSQCKPALVLGLIEKSPLLEGHRKGFLILDIAEKKSYT